MNRKTRAATTAALLGVVLLLEGCALFEWVNYGDKTVQQRLPRHDGPWVVYTPRPGIPKNSRIILTMQDIQFEGSPERIPLTLVNEQLGAPVALKIAADTRPDLTACIDWASHSAKQANWVGMRGSKCLVVWLTAHPSNLERDRITFRLIDLDGGEPADPGIVAGGPRPSMRYPIVNPEKTETRSGR